MFVRAANPIWYMVDHVGQPLNDEYYAFFLTNTLPYLPQNVYRDPQGMTVWTGDIVQFSPAGTLPDNLYFDPDLVYRIEIRHGNSQTDALIWEINNFVPEGNANIITNNQILSTENLVSNSQFSAISFVSPLVIASAGTYEVAPGWELVLTGAGTTTITQEITTGVDNTGNPPGNPTPPYYLKIANSGWTTAILRQRFSGNGELFNNGAVTMSVTARAEVASELISLTYSPENPPGTPKLVKSATLTTGDFQIVGGVINTGQSTNSNANNVSYVDMLIALPGTGTVDISNVQFLGQTTPLTDPTTSVLPAFQQDTEERQLDHLFHFYADQLITKPKKNILSGWNFPLNPFQFVATALTAQTAQTVYIADQTILHQETANNLNTGQAANDQRQGLEIQPQSTATNSRFAIIQYIDPSTIRAYWSYILSSLVRARIFTTHGTQVHLKMRLIWRTDLPPTLSPTEPIASWALASDPVFAAGWTAIAPLNDPSYLLPNSYEDGGSTINAYPAFAFEQFQLPNASTANMTLGIVLYTMDRMNGSAGTQDIIVFDKVSLLPNEFACEADPQTYDQVLKECQFYYEKSYEGNALAGTITSTGVRHIPAPYYLDGGGGANLARKSFSLEYNTIKRAHPVVTFYAPSSATMNRISLELMTTGAVTASADVDSVASYSPVPSTKNLAMTPQTGGTVISTPASTDVEGRLTFQFSADARLGL